MSALSEAVTAALAATAGQPPEVEAAAVRAAIPPSLRWWPEPTAVKVKVSGELIDWATVTRVQLRLRYEDSANQVLQEGDFILKAEDPDAEWEVLLDDTSKQNYSWTASYFMNDGNLETIGPETARLTAVLLIPAR